MIQPNPPKKTFQNDHWPKWGQQFLSPKKKQKHLALEMPLAIVESGSWLVLVGIWISHTFLIGSFHAEGVGVCVPKVCWALEYLCFSSSS